MASPFLFVRDMNMVVSFQLRRKMEAIILEDMDGTPIQAAIVELDGTERDAYLSFIASKMTMGQDGKVGRMKDTKGLQTMLLSKSIYKATHDENGNVRAIAETPFPEKEIVSWPSSVISSLYDKSQALSGLGKKKGSKEDEEDEEGND